MPRTGSFRTFTAQGDATLPIPNGSDITVRFTDDWSRLTPRTTVAELKAEQGT
ncbi:MULTISPECIES: hypothetical protein [Sphingobacterium]|uniref:hypothetical protein n=1 Tax=Sphingobacterium TaxID=28453 RepID=UPI0013E45186|nr:MULTISPECIES: hypothetical protein [Sphingobacterium]QIH34851.1 hypothetical protein G6053_18975 [Sphingobacterium sp. DR205]